ncbi:MAG: Eco57I restriction-modification methylase domain-containing protein [Alphaproteobacteria bacterium]|nr:Eco57I restriction-modification methylase domain-containing protein [Alphaproteobacteria bacterium]
MAADGDDAERGAVYTKRSVVDAILDLVGYVEAADLSSLRVLEPSFGGGDFLFPVVDRLLASYERTGAAPAEAAEALAPCIRAVEIHTAAVASTRTALVRRLASWGLPGVDAEKLADVWLQQDDFLLADLDGPFDAVVGNPPYVRQERIPPALMAAYRKQYKTIYDRADLYVPFYERCLDLLGEGGRLGFICANRWIKNKYGGPLRAKVSKAFSLLFYIDMENVDAFQTEVIAYPAITVIQRRMGSSPVASTRIALQPDPGPASMARLSAAMLNGGPASDSRVAEVPNVANGRDPWLLDEPLQLQLLRRLEAAFPSLEEAGCNVGIGVATGADNVFIGDLEGLPVETKRKLPLVMAPDLLDGRIEWRGRGVLNPFNDDGSLAALEQWPLFAAFLETHRDRIAGRHVAKKNPTRWYRTIDRIYPSLTSRPKLLIPDIKGTATVVYDRGEYYPHHNLYFVVSDTWDLRALQTVLRSSVAVMFVAAYCVRMAGGFLRFQAQYLRRIRAPHWEAVSEVLRADLIAAAEAREQAVIDEPVFRLFGLDRGERAMVSALADDAQVRPVGQRKQ